MDICNDEKIHKCCMKHCLDGNLLHFSQTRMLSRPSATLMENFNQSEWSIDGITMASKVGHLECMKLLFNYYKVKPQIKSRLIEFCSYTNIECYKWVLETFNCTVKSNQLAYSIYGKNIECFKYIYDKLRRTQGSPKDNFSNPVLGNSYIQVQKFGLQYMDIFDWELEYIRKDYPDVFCDADELKFIDSEIDMFDFILDKDNINVYTYAICFRFPRIQEFIINSYDIIDRECLTIVYKLYKQICLVMKEKTLEVLKENTNIARDVIDYVIKEYL
jgi:hypothetical protein